MWLMTSTSSSATGDRVTAPFGFGSSTGIEGARKQGARRFQTNLFKNATIS